MRKPIPASYLSPVVLRNGVPNTRRGRLWRRLTRCWIGGHEPEPHRPTTYGPGFGLRECVWCGLSIEQDGRVGRHWTARIRQ